MLVAFILPYILSKRDQHGTHTPETIRTTMRATVLCARTIAFQIKWVLIAMHGFVRGVGAYARRKLLSDNRKV